MPPRYQITTDRNRSLPWLGFDIVSNQSIARHSLSSLTPSITSHFSFLISPSAYLPLSPHTHHTLSSLRHALWFHNGIIRVPIAPLRPTTARLNCPTHTAPATHAYQPTVRNALCIRLIRWTTAVRLGRVGLDFNHEHPFSLSRELASHYGRSFTQVI